jgi:hypothetical protein
MLQNGFNTGLWSKRRGGHSAISNAEMKRPLPAPIYGSSEVGEVSTDLLHRECRRLDLTCCVTRSNHSRQIVSNRNFRFCPLLENFVVRLPETGDMPRQASIGQFASGEDLKSTAVVNPFALWQTLGMTNQPVQTQPQRVPIRREDRKAQKLMAEIHTKLALQAKAALKPDSLSRN